MLDLRPTCENCNKPLPPNATDAMICTFECTFCKECVDNVMENVCPNCGGGFVKRPIRPKHQLEKYPASEKVIYKPIDLETFETLKARVQNVSPPER